MTKRKLLLAAIVPVAALLLMAQTYGPQVFAPFMTVGGGTRATDGLRVNGDVTITGTCTGCPTSSGANPSASVGLSAVNGSANTFLRSDGAPALSQSITPTWSGVHVFNAIPDFNGGTSGASAPFTVDSTQLVTNLNADKLDGQDYETGNFTVNYGNACTTTPSQTWDYIKIGNMVTLKLDSTSGFPCTGDVTSFSSGAVPANLIPVDTAISPVFGDGGCQDNGVVGECAISISGGGLGLMAIGDCTGGTVCNATGWQATGNRAGPALGVTWTYMVSDP